jgi:membrane associated rhomboid family serine protease
VNADFDDAWTEVDRFRTTEEAEQHALVLAALGIRSRIVFDEASVSLRVMASDASRARSEIAAYVHENRRPMLREPRLRPFRDGIDGALAYCAVLVFIHAAATRQAFSLDWLSIGSAEAGRIVAGEWWRTVTALGLHADLGHLLSNLVAGAAFGMLLSRILGSGLAWLAILLCGALGNAAVAFLRSPDHDAIGASTAVFAALGLLAALAWRRQAALWSRGHRRWLPLAAGFMMLALVGVSGERTDVGAHFAGFLAGCGVGALLHVVGSGLPQGRRAQYAYGAAAAALFAASWLAAITAAA